jgi:hypothetical protein
MQKEVNFMELYYKIDELVYMYKSSKDDKFFNILRHNLKHVYSNLSYKFKVACKNEDFNSEFNIILWKCCLNYNGEDFESYFIQSIYNYMNRVRKERRDNFIKSQDMSSDVISVEDKKSLHDKQIVECKDIFAKLKKNDLCVLNDKLSGSSKKDIIYKYSMTDFNYRNSVNRLKKAFAFR